MGISGFFKRERDDKNNIKQLRARYHLNRKPLEEPTYLGYKVLFDFVGASYSPLLKLVDNEEGSVSKSPGDALGFGSGVNIPFNQKDSTGVDSNGSLLIDSAEKYLMNNGYSDKAGYLRSFVNQLSQVSKDAEWYFKGITGLESAFNFNFADTKVRGENGESVISIQLDETLDMKITSMLGSYYSAIFDVANRRDLLPENLKYFSMSVYVSDFRDFVAYDKRLLTGNYDSVGQLAGRALGKSDIQTIDIPIVIMTFHDCFIDPYALAEMFADINNGEPQQAMQKLDIRYCGEVEYEFMNLNENDIISSKSDASVIKGKINSIGDKVNNFAKKVGVPDTVADGVTGELATLGNRLAGQGLGIINQNIEKVRGELRSLALGNVYDTNLSNSVQEALLNGAARSIVPGLDRNPFNGE